MSANTRHCTAVFTMNGKTKTNKYETDGSEKDLRFMAVAFFDKNPDTSKLHLRCWHPSLSQPVIYEYIRDPDDVKTPENDLSKTEWAAEATVDGFVRNIYNGFGGGLYSHGLIITVYTHKLDAEAPPKLEEIYTLGDVM